MKLERAASGTAKAGLATGIVGTSVNYMNATFYPKQVADVTTGTTTTAQTLYNPLPVTGNCNCDC